MITIQSAVTNPGMKGQTKIEFVTSFDATYTNCYIEMTVPTSSSQGRSISNFRGLFINGNHLSEIGNTITVNWYKEDGTLTSTLTCNVFYDATYDLTICNSITYTGVFAYGAPSESNYMATGYLAFYDNLTDEQRKANARQYFNNLPPEMPYFGTCDIFSKGDDGAKLFTVVWDNIQNMLPGTYEATYQVLIKVSANYPGHENWYNVEYVPYKSKKYQFTFADIIGNMPADDRQVAETQQQCALQVILGYNDPDFTQCDLVSFSVDNLSGDIVVSSPGAGTTTPHSNTNPRTNDTYNPGTGTAGTQAPGQAMSIDNLLTTSYKLTETQLRDFGNYLWNNDLQLTLFANQTAPIENVLSCKRIPFDVAVQTGTPTILLGNVDTGITAQKTAATHLLDIGSVTIPVKHNSFLDFSNNISIYLPYCGIQTIPTSLCYVMDVDPNTQIPYLTGKTLNVKYIYDIIFGTCAAVLSLNGKEFAVYNGNCGIDIPITASNRAETQLSLIHSGANAAIGTVASVTKGAIMGGAIGAGLAGIDAAATMAQQVTAQMFQDRHYTTSGGFSSQIASYLSSSVTLFVESPVYDKPGDYEHENGYPCNLSCTLNTLTGYTELDGSIEISGEIPCLEEEREMLKQALMDGFYL